MSLLLTTSLQIGKSGNAEHNCFLAPDPAVPGQFKLKRGNAGGGTQDLLTIDPSGNVLIDVNPATGNRSKQLATMQKFSDEFGATLGQSGSQKLPNGFTFKWGRGRTGAITAGSIADASIVFPVAFVSSVFQVMTTPSNLAGGGTTFSSENESITGFMLRVSSNTNVSDGLSYRWFAIGV